MIRIKMFAMLKQYMPETDENGYWTLEAAGQSVTDVIAQTGLPEANVKYLLLVNNVRAKPDQTLLDGDVMTVTPLLAGG